MLQPAPTARELSVLAEKVDAPCRNYPELWFSKYVDDRRKAAQWCRDSCLALVPCRRYAEEYGEEHGVWGGVSLIDARRAE